MRVRRSLAIGVAAGVATSCFVCSWIEHPYETGLAVVITVLTVLAWNFAKLVAEDL